MERFPSRAGAAAKDLTIVQGGASSQHPPTAGVPPAHRIAAQELANEAAVSKAVASLGAAGIPSILLKGPSFATWLYPEGGRTSVDVDLLVPPEGFDRAEALLSRRGFVHDPLDDLEGDKPWHAHAWYRERDGANIDLHRTLLGLRKAPADVWKVLASRTVMLSLGDRDVRALDEPARCLHVALHVAQGGTSTDKARRDLVRALAVAPPSAWAEAAELAESLDGLAAFSAGLRIDAGRGAAVAERLGLPDRFAPELELRRRNAPAEAIGLAWFLSLPTTRARLRWLRAKLLPPPSFMRAWDEHAQVGGLSLLLAYPRRWCWLATRLPGAFRQWRHAR
jgi:hypothetical protein